MFGMHHTLTRLAGGTAIAGLVAVVAVSSAVAGTHGRHVARGQACQAGPPGWVSVTDDLGVPFLQPATQALCNAAVSQAPAAQPQTAGQPASVTLPALKAPYPGWVFVIDDLGIPYLVPVGQAG